jgi:NAD(P)-dependent dehydrogenase (short-subunit alcohol dehydrogenase family)
MERPLQNFTGRVAIVTGAAKGLGRAYAEYLAARGARVIVNNRRRANALPDQTANAVVEIIRAAGGSAIASTHDVGDPASGGAMVALALETYGRLDILVNNAGVPEGKPFAKMSIEEFRSVFDINFFGHLYVTHAAFKAMTKASYGRIVVSTSSAGLYANPGMPAYSSSKAGLIGLMRSLALERFMFWWKHIRH